MNAQQNQVQEVFGPGGPKRYRAMVRETKEFTPDELRRLAAVYEDWTDWLHSLAALREPAPHSSN